MQFYTTLALLAQLLHATGEDAVGSPCAGTAALVNFGCPNSSIGAGNFKCLCQKTEFLQTVGHCIIEYSNGSHHTQNQAFEYLSELCRIRARRHISPDELIALTLKSTVKTNWVEGDTTLYRTPVRLAADGILDHNFYVRSTQVDFTNLTRRLAIGILIYFASILTIVSLVHLIPTNRLPSNKLYLYIQRCILIAPTFSYHHSLTVSPFHYNIPTRGVSFIVLGCVCVNVIFLAIGYHYIVPNYSFPTYSDQAAAQLAERAGYLAISHIPILILFAGRNNWLLWTTGLPIDTYLTIHRWIARILVSELVIHSVCYTISRIQMGRLRKSWHARFWIFGFIALACAGIILVQGFVMLRRRSYEVFLWCHISLAILFVAFAWQHLSLVDEGRVYLEVAVAFWGLDRVLRILRSLYLSQTSIYHMGTRACVRLHADDIIEVCLESTRARAYPGSFCFLINLQKPWESHPFSIIQGTNDKSVMDKPRQIHIFARVKNGMTRRLADKVRHSKGSDDKIYMPVFLEGVYGTQLPFELYQHVLLVCGGIGITGVYSYAKFLLEEHPSVHVQLVWYIADASALEWFNPHLASLQPSRDSSSGIKIFVKAQTNSEAESQLDLHETLRSKLNLKRISVSCVRPEVRQVVADEIDFYIKSAASPRGSRRHMAVLSCGPGRMNDDVRSMIVSHRGGPRIDYHEESFTW